MFTEIIRLEYDSLRCLEGADCLKDASCAECDGVACTRIISFNTEDNKEVALTCLPQETRVSFGSRPAQLEEEGCRHMGDRLMCVCYDRDYCNTKESFNFIGGIVTVILLGLL